MEENLSGSHGAGGPASADTNAELRRLAHDLANALEVIVQACYLLKLSNLQGDAAKWADMADQGAHQASQLNIKLRELVRANSNTAAS